MSLDRFFEDNQFLFFHYYKEKDIIELNRSEDNQNDTLIFSELKLIVDQLMKEPYDFHILDNGNIRLEKS